MSTALPEDLLGAFAAGDVIDGRYTLRGLVGRGGFGAVYRADDRDGGPCALKLIPFARSTEREAAEREAAHLEQQAHPGFVAFRAKGRHGAGAHGFVYIAMELGGASLEDELGDRGRIEGVEVAALIADLLDALDHLHAKGVVHGDVKPANLVRVGGRFKLCDLGSARGPLDDARLSSGTPENAAPEAFAGEAGPAADLWSVGVLVHRCLAGRSPFRFPSDDLDDIARVVREREPSIDRALPAPFAAIVRGCLERDPARRFTSADVRAALPAVPRIAPRPKPRRAPAMPLLALVACALLAVLAIGGTAVAHSTFLPVTTPSAAR